MQGSPCSCRWAVPALDKTESPITTPVPGGQTLGQEHKAACPCNPNDEVPLPWGCLSLLHAALTAPGHG